MLLVVLGLGLFGLVTSTVFAAMVLVGAPPSYALGNGGASQTQEELLSLSLLKPLHGAEPGLEANLDTFFKQDYPAYAFEILFCTRDVDDAGLAIARKVSAHYPEIATKFFWTNGQPPYINAKVASLEKMTTAARYPILVISDSDVQVDKDYLRAVARAISRPGRWGDDVSLPWESLSVEASGRGLKPSGCRSR